MADALLTLGGFQARCYETLLVDRLGNSIDRASDYVLFHVPTSVDVFDWERSRYDMFPSTAGQAAGKIAVLYEMVLRAATDLPPCFYVMGAYRSGLIVNDRGRQPIEGLAGVGVGFAPVHTFRGPPAMI